MRIIPTTTRDKELLAERNKLIKIAYYEDKFTIVQIAKMFRLGKSEVGKVIFKSKTKL